MVNRSSGPRVIRRRLFPVSEQIETRMLLSATSVLENGAIADAPDQAQEPDSNTILVSQAGDGMLAPDDATPIDVALFGLETPDDLSADDVPPDEFVDPMFLFTPVQTTVQTSGQFESSLVVDMWPSYDDNGNLISVGTIRNQFDDAVYTSPDHIILHVVAGNPIQIADDWGLTDYKVIDDQTLYIPVPITDGLDAFWLASAIDAGPGGSVQVLLNDANGDPALSQVIDLQTTTLEFVDQPVEILPYYRNFFGGITDDQPDDGGAMNGPEDGIVVDDSSIWETAGPDEFDDVPIDVTFKDPVLTQDDTPHIRYFMSPGSAELQRGGGVISESTLQLTGPLILTPMATQTASVTPVSTNALIPVVQRRESRLFNSTEAAGGGIGVAGTTEPAAISSQLAGTVQKATARTRSSLVSQIGSLEQRENLELSSDQLAPSLQGLDSSLGHKDTDTTSETETPKAVLEDTSVPEADVTQIEQPSYSATPVAFRRDAIDQFMSEYAHDSFA